MSSHGSDRTEEFVKLLTQHQPEVFHFILSLLPQRADADDVLQDTNLLLWKKFDTYQSGTNFRAWAMQIASFRVKKFIEQRQQSKLQFGEAFVDQVAAMAVGELENLSRRQVALEQCLQELPAKDRKLIELRYLATGSLAAVAKATSRSTQAVYKGLQRARDALYLCVEGKLEVEECS